MFLPLWLYVSRYPCFLHQIHLSSEGFQLLSELRLPGLWSPVTIQLISTGQNRRVGLGWPTNSFLTISLKKLKLINAIIMYT